MQWGASDGLVGRSALVWQGDAHRFVIARLIAAQGATQQGRSPQCACCRRRIAQLATPRMTLWMTFLVLCGRRDRSRFKGRAARLDRTGRRWHSSLQEGA